MEQCENNYYRSDMVCDNPKGTGLELVHMPQFFTTKPPIETSCKHVHGFYEIVWFEKGQGSHFVDFNEFPVTDGAVFFISPGQVHSFDGNTNQTGCLIKICSHLFDDTFYGDNALINYNIFNAHDGLPYKHIDTQCVQQLKNIIAQMEEENNKQNELANREYLQSLIKMLIIHILRSQTKQDCDAFSPNRAAHRYFLAFRKELENNYRKLHTVKDYAALLNISTKSLTNYVNQCSPTTPLEMINNRITLEAKRMLRYSDLMIKEVAYTLGFDDPSYFIKFFKRQVHCAPADYRTPE